MDQHERVESSTLLDQAKDGSTVPAAELHESNHNFLVEAARIILVALAAAGLLRLTLAAFIHVTSELTFILNSARLLPRASQGAAVAEMPTASENGSLAQTA